MIDFRQGHSIPLPYSMLLASLVVDDSFLKKFFDGVAVDGVDSVDGVRSVEFTIGLEKFNVFFGEVAVERSVAGVLVGAEAFETIGFFLGGIEVCMGSFVGG